MGFINNMVKTINILLQTGAAFFILIAILSINACIRGSIYEEVYKIESAIEPPILKVGLSKYLGVDSVRISIDSSFNITRLDGWIIMRNTKIRKATCTSIGDNIKIDDLTIKEKIVRLEPLNDGTVNIDGTNYHGNILIHNENDKISLVNEVNVEDYLSGVIGKEIGNSSPEAALKTQAITARTFAIYEQRTSSYKNEKRIFDLYDDQRSQVYGGIDSETSVTIKVVRETRGTVLAYNNKLVKTFYSSTCGGYTEPAWEIFPNDIEKGLPPLAGGKCGYCTSSKYYNWKATFKKDELLKILLPDKSEKMLQSLTTSRYLPGGHVAQIAVTISGEPNNIVLDAYSEFRRRINSIGTSPNKNIRSTLFEIKDIGDSYQFIGKGWGHAIGLCQVGAINMASLGWDYRTILQYYYPQADIVKIY